MTSKTRSKLTTLLKDAGGYRACRGSKEHPHINRQQLDPWIFATIRYFWLKRKQQDIRLFMAECEAVLSQLYPRPQQLRRGTPRERAHAMIANVYAQQTAKRRGRFKGYLSLPVSFILVLHALAVEVCIRHAGRPTSRPRWRWIQIARSIHHLLRSDTKIYTQDDGRGNIRDVKVRHRLSLQSWNVAKQIALTLEPLYRMDLAEHHSAIASKVNDTTYGVSHC